MSKRTSRGLGAASQRWVVKIGSALLTADGKGLDTQAIAGWVDQLAALCASGVELVLVSSGSIAEGMVRLGWQQRPTEVYNLQAAAAVGQMGLVQCYERNFARHGKHTAQILLTHDDLSNRKRYLNARSTLQALVDYGVVPVVNENDTVVTNEIRFGDNDTLGALVANLVEADLLIILTDQDGLCNKDPRHHADAELLHEVRAGDPALDSMAGSKGGALGSGGMFTKVQAAKLAARSGTQTIVANGREKDILLRLREDELLGTLFITDQEPLVARKQWLAGHLQAKGEVWLDAGAVAVLQQQGKSLLAVGVTRVVGDFSRGEMVQIKDPQGAVIGRGLVNYKATEANQIIGLASNRIAAVLGYVNEPELIHRDNLVLV
ncbi:MAG: glutamate 5-kinase [Gammaproteobacteria bacterium]|jgi:glutamate 5-kinase|nr:glutamate 5-kinase [Gammaproteobacteria bacterium]